MEVIFLFLFCNCQRCLRGKSCIRSLAGCYLSYRLKHQSAATLQHIQINLASQCKAAEGHIQFLFCFFTSNIKCFLQHPLPLDFASQEAWSTLIYDKYFTLSDYSTLHISYTLHFTITLLPTFIVYLRN